MTIRDYEDIRFPFTHELVFPIVMQNADIAKRFLNLVIPDKTISMLEINEAIASPITPEKVLNLNVTGHGIRLDVLFEGDPEWVDIEMQVTNRHDLPKRIRYYHSLMTAAYLKRGRNYKELNPQYVIFICCFDPIGAGDPIYDIRSTVINSGLPFKDESYTILLNTTAAESTVPDILRPFFEYVSSGKVIEGDELVQDIHKQVVSVNNDSDWREALMTWEEYLDDKLAEKYEQGKTEGKTEGKLEQIAAYVKEGIITEDVAYSTADDPESLRKLLSDKL